MKIVKVDRVLGVSFKDNSMHTKTAWVNLDSLRYADIDPVDPRIVHLEFYGAGGAIKITYSSWQSILMDLCLHPEEDLDGSEY